MDDGSRPNGERTAILGQIDRVDVHRQAGRASLVSDRLQHRVGHFRVRARAAEAVFDDDLEPVDPARDRAGPRACVFGGLQGAAVTASPAAVRRERPARLIDARREDATLGLIVALLGNPFRVGRQVQDGGHSVVEERQGIVIEDASTFRVGQLEDHWGVQMDVAVDEPRHRESAASVEEARPHWRLEPTADPRDPTVDEHEVGLRLSRAPRAVDERHVLDDDRRGRRRRDDALGEPPHEPKDAERTRALHGFS